MQRFISQATDAVKEFLGMDSYPQSSVRHDAPYLNDIARGNWSDLRRTNTKESYVPVVGFPANYTWPTRKINVNFVRYPFLSQIKQHNSLRPVQTIDKSIYVIDKNYRMRAASDRKQLLSEIQSFNLSGLKSIPKGPTLISQAKDAVSGAYVGVKEALGINYWPQSQTTHENRFLNDIVKGNWNKLNHVSTKETTMPVVGFPAGYNLYSGLRFRINTPRRPLYLDQIRRGQRNLRRQEARPLDNGSNQLISMNFKDWRMQKPQDRRQLMLSIRKFDPSSLHSIKPSLTSDLMFKAKSYVSEKVDSAKEMIGMNTYPQSSTDHTAAYLNDIAKGGWDKLKHVDQIQERSGVVGDSNWKMGKGVDRAGLLEEVKEGCDLKHVQTVEKGKDLQMDRFTLKKGGEERTNLLSDIRGFENDSLSHVGSS